MLIGCASTVPPTDGAGADAAPPDAAPPDAAPRDGGPPDTGLGDAGCLLTSCGTDCVDTETDVHHCGGCGRDCAALEGVRSDAVRCQAGACRIDDACEPGHGDCDRDAASGCEVTLTSVEHCGGCDVACAAPAGATASCDGASCDFTCGAGLHRCGDACVADTSVSGCGASCTPCPAPANATASCDGTSCGFACNAGFHLCGEACVANTSASACGPSCTPCPAPANATATCDGTSCGYECNAGFHACGTTCAANTSATACGPGCIVCPVPANGSAVCSWGACAITCHFGFMPSGGSCVPIGPTVTLTSPNPTATEGLTDTATFRIARTGSTASPLTVQLTIAASSTVTVVDGGVLPVDFGLTGASVSRTDRSVTVVIPVGASSVDLIMSARTDTHAEAAETLRLEVVADPAYALGVGTAATATIAGGGTAVIASGDSLTDYALREGSLRLALANARSVPGGPTIDASIPGPITLVASLPPIDFNVTIQGPAPARLVVEGDGTFRLMETRGTVRLSYLELRRGADPVEAGAILNRGSLTIDHCRLADHHADTRGSAVYSGAASGTPSLVVRDSLLENNTGAPALESGSGTMSIGNSTFAGNTAGNVSGTYTNLGGNTPAAP